jgi:hypothetical protein
MFNIAAYVSESGWKRGMGAREGAGIGISVYSCQPVNIREV